MGTRTYHHFFFFSNYHQPTSMVLHWRCAKLNEAADGRTTHNSEEEHLEIHHSEPDVPPHPLHIQKSSFHKKFPHFMEINSVSCGDFYSSFLAPESLFNFPQFLISQRWSISWIKPSSAGLALIFPDLCP